MEISATVRNSTSVGPKNREPMVTKCGVGDDVGNSYPCGKFHGFWGSPDVLLESYDSLHISGMVEARNFFFHSDWLWGVLQKM